MKSRNTVLLAAIIILSLVSIYIDLPKSPGVHIALGPIQIDRSFTIKQGLDLQGGLQVLLEADVPPDQQIEAGAMEQVAKIIDSRVNALGVVEPLVQTQGTRRIIVELPGIEDPEKAIEVLKETSLLEFVDAGNQFLPIGTKIQTTYPQLVSDGATTHDVSTSDVAPTPQAGETPTSTTTITGTEGVTSTTSTGDTPALTTPVTGTEGVTITPPSGVTTTTGAASEAPTSTNVVTPPVSGGTTTPSGPSRVYADVITGEHLKSATAYRDPNTGEFGISFELTDAGAKLFSDFTTAHADYNNAPYYYLAIVLDKEVISCPHISSAIPDGKGQISGNFTLDEVNNLAVQLRFGALPIPLKVETTRSIGPTLGQESVQRSVQAGAVGLSIVLLFMLVYYRLPGFLADLALILYGLFNFAIYKFIPVTLTLPAITGFILSTGMAVDANILVFERMKEELRAGKSLGAAMEAGFSRAWTSIRDSNISTLITCGILFYFGSTFGAGTVKGFAITLALGVLINIFTAITVTRTFIRLVFDWLGEKLHANKFLLGV